jgi:hypothetical protein
MTQHIWGDKDCDWKGIDDAARYIGLWLRRYARMNVSDIKEKWGQPRVYVSFGWHQLFCITHPGYAYSRYPKWLWYLDIYYISGIVQLLNPVVVPIHKFLYKWRYKKAIQKWPHLKGEILSGADWPELLKDLGSGEYWEFYNE